MDFLQHIINTYPGNDEPTWRITFSDGEHRRGKLENIGDSAYVLTGRSTYYFSSAQVIRVELTEPE